MSWTPHAIRQGEYLSALADALGHSADEIWENEQNSELREARSSYDVLAAGDVLYLPPAREQAGQRLQLNTTNSFRGRIARVPVEVQLKQRGEPVANEAYTATGMGMADVEGTTDGEGMVRLQVPRTTRMVQIDAPNVGIHLDVRVGHLDPASEWSGAATRLTQLGLLRPPPRRIDPVLRFHYTPDAERERVRRALTAFQSQEGLDATGELDEDTQDALIRRHGS